VLELELEGAAVGEAAEVEVGVAEGVKVGPVAEREPPLPATA